MKTVRFMVSFVLPEGADESGALPFNQRRVYNLSFSSGDS